MTDNTTRVIKLANGESIVCTCIPTRTDEVLRPCILYIL